MVLSSYPQSSRFVTNKWINETLALSDPKEGLTVTQLKELANLCGANAAQINVSHVSPKTYRAILHSIVDSGFPALLVFSTDDPDDHVVGVFGHTKNTDEWHPQTGPAYSGAPSAHYYASSEWVDHFIIHDDNFGPYFCFNSKSLEEEHGEEREADAKEENDNDEVLEEHGDVEHEGEQGEGSGTEPTIGAKWIFGIFPQEIKLFPSIAENLSAIQLYNVLSKETLAGESRWLNYITEYNWQYVLRTTLVHSDHYKDHLRGSVGHDGSRLGSDEMDFFDSLPKFFWMTEFSLPSLSTGNGSKLGEVLVEADKKLDEANMFDSIIGVRVPLNLFLSNPNSKMSSFKLSLDSHSKMFQRYEHNHEW